MRYKIGDKVNLEGHSSDTVYIIKRKYSRKEKEDENYIGGYYDYTVERKDTGERFEVMEYSLRPIKDEGRKGQNVNHPSHYQGQKYEVIDIIDDYELGFTLGNAIKYILRSSKKHKERPTEDLEKAIWYLRHEIETISGADTCK